MTTQTLKEFKKLNLPIFQKLEKLYYNKMNEDDRMFIEKNIRLYQSCAIGSLRQKFDLPVGQEGKSYNCYKCKQLADEFPSKYELLQMAYEELESYGNDSGFWIEKIKLQQRIKEYQQEYESILLDTKRHFRMIHNKELI